MDRVRSLLDWTLHWLFGPPVPPIVVELHILEGEIHRQEILTGGFRRVRISNGEIARTKILVGER